MSREPSPGSIENAWTANAADLAEAYVRNAGGTIRFELVTRALLMHMPTSPQRVVDVGGGFGQQAIMLARLGHSVVIVDSDPTMLSIAQDKLSDEPEEVRSRVELVLSDAAAATSLVGTGFDLACCHSVLMYEEDPAPMLLGLVHLVRAGGLISVLSTNPEASAMRCGLQGRWREAAATLQSGREVDSHLVSTHSHAREDVACVLEAAGARHRVWYGVGVFTDHHTEKIIVEDPEEVYWAEWLAGSQDPYRHVARCFHLIAERT